MWNIIFDELNIAGLDYCKQGCMQFQIFLTNWKRKFQEYDSKFPFPDRIKSRAFPYNQPQGFHKPPQIMHFPIVRNTTYARLLINKFLIIVRNCPVNVQSLSQLYYLKVK